MFIEKVPKELFRSGGARHWVRGFSTLRSYGAKKQFGQHEL